MNYFEYFSEIEERFNARRGTLLLLSTLDWALIETWREAGIPLPAVLRGIDDAFDRYQARKARSKGRLGKVNGLAWCAQAVMEAAQEMAEASIGGRAEPAPAPQTGFEAERVAGFLDSNAAVLENLKGSGTLPGGSTEAAASTASRMRELAADVRAGSGPEMEELDQVLSVLEERLRASLLTQVAEEDLLAARSAADAALKPYRGRLQAAQLRQVREQFVHKQLFQQLRLPRFSLFYMPVAEGDPSHGSEPAS